MERGKQQSAPVNDGDQVPANSSAEVENVNAVPVKGEKKSNEVEQQIYEKLKSRGEKSLNAYTMASANVSKKDATRMAEDMAMDAIEKWQQEEDAKLGKGISAIPGKIKNSVVRALKLDEFKSKSQKEIDEQLNNEKALADRVAEAYAVGKENEDTGIKNLQESEKISFAEVRKKKVADLTENEQMYRMVGKFAEKVAKSTDADDKKIDAEKLKVLENLRALNQKGSIKANNYAEVLEQIQNDLKGSLAQEMIGDRKRANAAVKALDRYLSENFTVVSADVEVGLAAKQAYAKLQDKNVLKYGAVIGSAIGLGSAVIGGMSKNKIINTIFGMAPVASAARVAVAGAIGGNMAYKAEKNIQIRDNIREALKMNEKAIDEEVAKNVEAKIAAIDKNKDKSKVEDTSQKAEKKISQFDIVDVDQKISEMNRLADVKRLHGKYSLERAAELIADLKARNVLQNKEHIQLLGYKGRENVEKQKMEMFKAINRLKKTMSESYGQDKEKVARFIEMKMEQKLKGGNGEIGLEEQIGKTLAVQKKERLNAALKGALVAATSAAVFELARSLNVREAMGYKQEKTVSPETIEKYSDKSLIMSENQANGTKVFGFDMDHDGVLNAEKGDKILRENFNLTNERDFHNLRAELRENYHIDLDRQAIANNRYSEISLGSYLEKANNTIEHDISDVNWSKSATKVAFSNPFTTSAESGNYQVSVWGVNGGEVPEGAKLFVDLDGKGPGKALEFAIKDGKAIIPSDIVEVANASNGDMANFIGSVRVGELQDGEMISYAGMLNKGINLSDKIVAQTSEKCYSFTAWTLNNTGDRLKAVSQFAVNENNQPISNMSEIFNGVIKGKSENLPMTFMPSGEADGDLALKSGALIKKHTILGGYHEEFDSFKNTAFYDGGNSSYLGTALKFDISRNGALSAENEASVIRQMFVRTATNPYTLGQNASNYGILEPKVLAEKIFKGNKYLMEDNLRAWGIADGVIDSEKELDLFMQAMKKNPIYWDRLANETLNEMGKQLENGGIEVARVTNRISTFANKGILDTGRANSARTVFYPYKMEDGQKVYVGNKGWWVRKWQGVEGGKVGDVAISNQKCIAKAPVVSTPTVSAPVSAPTPTPAVAPLPVKPSVEASVVVGQPPISSATNTIGNFRARPTVSPVITTLAREETTGPGIIGNANIENKPNIEASVPISSAFSEFLN